jgi:hypothetical protein
MKYIIGLLLFTTTMLGYFVIDMKFINPISNSNNNPVSIGKENIPNQLDSKSSDEVMGLRMELSKQSALTRKLEEDNLSYGNKIIILEKALKDNTAIMQSLLLANKSISGISGSSKETGEPAIKTAGQFNPVLDPILTGEIFDDPQFAKVFYEEVIQAFKEMQKKEREEQMAQAKIQMQQRIAKRIEEFAKTASLNDYQQKEMTKILSESSSKGMDLFSQMREENLSGEELRLKQESIRKEANEKIKMLVSPQQYEQYQKIEQSILRGGMSIGRQPDRIQPANR